MFTAEHLKEEGNALFRSSKYREAISKYTEAIELDGNNAVFYANRSACHLARHSFEDAKLDAEKSTQINPSYSKGWARLGTALHSLQEYERAVDAWRHAIDTVPSDNASANDIKLKKEYETKMLDAQNHSVGINCVGLRGVMPWHRAKAMEPELKRDGEASANSSAWVILSAYEEFIQGVTLMKGVTQVGPGLFGMSGGLERIVNSLLSESRIIHMDDPDWMTLYNRMIVFESAKANAWVEGGPEEIKQKALERVASEGWDSTRPALATTVRAWIMRGYMAGNLLDQRHEAAKYIGWAVDMIKWGRETWKDVADADRGAIFQETFSWGVRSLHLETLRAVSTKPPAEKAEVAFELMNTEAIKLVEDMKSSDLTPDTYQDLGFRSSFFVYPKARAFSAGGFYHAQISNILWNSKFEGAKEASNRNASEAAVLYKKAAELYPDDDENHGYFLICALENLQNCGSKLEDNQEIIDRIRLSIPKAKKLWVNSLLYQSKWDTKLDLLLEAWKE